MPTPAPAGKIELIPFFIKRTSQPSTRPAAARRIPMAMSPFTTRPPVRRWQIARPTPAPHTFAIAKTWGDPGKRRFVFVRGIAAEIEPIPFSVFRPG